MEKAKFTPGPYLKIGKDFIYADDKETGYNRWSASVKASNGFPESEAEAVRNLFLAAQEMFEKLQEIHKDGCDAEEGCSLCAILRKAEGK